MQGAAATAKGKTLGGGAKRRGGFRLRPVVVLLAVCGVFAVTTGLVLTPAARSGATPEDFVKGSAEAKADTVAAGIVAGGATIGLTWGRVLAQYQESVGIAEGRSLDLGILKSLLGTSCDGSPPALNPATIPPGIRVDSRQSGAEASHVSEALSPGADKPGSPVGTQDAKATSAPWSWAGTDTGDVNLFLVGLKGGRAEVSSQLVDGTRYAKAVVTGSELDVLGGLITFRDPRWEAEAKSGAETSTTGSFTFSAAKLFGIERSPADAEAGFDRFAADVSRSLAALGVHLDYPKVEIEDKRVKVTAMTFGITDPPSGARYLAPALAKLQPLREVFVDYLVKTDCNNATTVTVLDIALSILSGSGSVNLSVGGVEASTDDTVYASPFGEGAIGLGAGSASRTAAASAPRASVAAPAAGAPTPVTSAPDAVAASPDFAEASNRKFLDGSTGGAAVAVGAAALLGAAALAAGDFLVMRRGRRRIPDL